MENRNGNHWRATILVFLLLASASFIIAPDTVAAASEGDYVYTLSGSPSTATITKYVGSGGAISIPSTLGGCPTVGIGEWSFMEQKTLTSVMIPDSVISIGNSAFAGCTALSAIEVGPGNQEYTSVDGVLYNKAKTTLVQCPGGREGTFLIPLGVTTIGWEAFKLCTALNAVVMPDTLTSIGGWAFASCEKLTSMTIPLGVGSIGDYSFSSCTALNTVTIPESVTSIGESAFYECTSLISIHIPENTTSVGNGAFARCTALIALEVSETNPAYISVDGVLYDRSFTTLIQYPGGKVGAFAIPTGIGSIGDYSFGFSSALTNVSMPLSIGSIGDGAFFDCASLTTASMGGGVTLIGNETFTGCTSLASVTIPDSVISIGKRAFFDCISLTAVTIPHGVTSLGEEAFARCTSLTSISVNDTNPAYASVDGVLYDKQATKVIQCPGGRVGAFTIPDSVTRIGSEAFAECIYLTSVTIPDSVTSMGDLAFAECPLLTSVTMGNGLTSLGVEAFGHCTLLRDLSIGSGVTSIGDRAFIDCASLTTLIIPQNVTSIGIRAFAYCPALRSVHMGSGIGSIMNEAFLWCTSLTSISFQGLIAPTSVGANWTGGAPMELRGHASKASDFPPPENMWNGVKMGATLPALPNAPRALTAGPGDARVFLTWIAPSDDGGAPIDHYTVYQDGVEVAYPTENFTTVAGLQNGNSYSFAVAAHNAVGIGSQSGPVRATPQAAPTAQDHTMLYVGIAIAIIAVIAIAAVLMRRKK